MNKSVSIVIPNWNGKELLKKNLSSVIKAKSFSGNNIVEIVVVDDASTDDSVAFLEKNFSNDIRLIKHTENRGFSVTVNRGVRSAKGSLVCLLNTDVIPSDKFLAPVLKHFSDDQLFAVGLHEMGYGPSKGFFKDGYIQHGNYGELKDTHISFWASGGSGVFSKKIWKELHGLDEELYSPFYWEDIDIGYRAYKRGYKIAWEPGAHVVHKHESTISTSNFRKRYMDRIKERNQLLFTWKNLTSRKLFKKHVIKLVERTISHPGYIKIILLALKKRKILSKRRKREIKQSTVSDEVVFAKFS